jgi:pimeloyl-ACP methyl ester carboxylesterase
VVVLCHGGAVFEESMVRVGVEPTVELFVAATAGPAERTLLVVHGGPDWDHSYLREPLGELAGSHRVLLPDLRGCGRSTGGLPEHEYDWDAVVRDLLALLAAQHVETADVLGFSTGGRIAERLALAAPHRVRRLVVASSSMLPVPAYAFAGWAERDRRQAEGARLGPDPTGLTGPDLVRAWAFAAAPESVWRRDALPEYLRRLDGVRFSAEWLPGWQSGRLPNALPHAAVTRLARLAIPNGARRSAGTLARRTHPVPDLMPAGADGHPRTNPSAGRPSQGGVRGWWRWPGRRPRR